MKDFAQFKSVLITALVGIVLSFITVVYSAQAAALEKATADIVDIKLAVVELKTIVIELKKSNDRMTEIWYERNVSPVAGPGARRQRD